MKKNRKQKRFLWLMILVVALMCPGRGMAAQSLTCEEETVPPKEEEIYARSAVLMDAVNGRVLFEKNGNEKLPNASTTKILTCILVLEQMKSDEECLAVSAYAARQPKVHLGMREGERYLVRDLLYSLLLESHNDSAVALAEYIGNTYLSKEETLPSEDAVLLFVDEMNKKAKEIGCKDTSFVTPNGLDAVRIKNVNGEEVQTEHATTAEDLAKIMAYCVTKSPKREEFMKIAQTTQYSFIDVDGKRSFCCTNHNAFLTQMDGVLAGKTGFTTKAGYCYTAALDAEGRLYTIALLACGWPGHITYKWQDAKRLFHYGMEAFEKHTLTECGGEVQLPAMPVVAGQGKAIGVIPCTEVRVDSEEWEALSQSILLKKGSALSLQMDVPAYLNAPVHKGQKVGCVKIVVDGSVWQECPVFVENTVKKIDLYWCCEQIVQCFLLCQET